MGSKTQESEQMEQNHKLGNSDSKTSTENALASRSDIRTFANTSKDGVEQSESETVSRTVRQPDWVAFDHIDEKVSEEMSRSTSISSGNIRNSSNANPPRDGRRVSFCDEQLDSSPELATDHMSQRTATFSSAVYHAYTDGEECRESEVSLNLSSEGSHMRRRNRASGLSSLLSSCNCGEEKRGIVVTDSFVNECICCCSIL